MKINSLAVIASALTTTDVSAKGGGERKKYEDKYEAEPYVTRENWFSAGPNRWAFKHIQQLLNMNVMTKGSEYDVAKLPYSKVDYDVENIKYIAHDDPVLGQDDGTGFPTVTSWTEKERTIKEALERTYTDGIVIIWNGDIIYEKYFDGQTENTRHIMFSNTKSYVGLMASMMAHDGLLDPDAMVTDYLPDMKNSALSDATVREVMDMSTDYIYLEDYADMTSEIIQHTVAANWLEVDGYTGPGTTRDFLIGLKKVADEPHGEKFTYRSSNTDVLGWIIDSILGYNGDSTKYFSENLWSKLGQEHDALISVDTTHFPAWYGGSTVTTRDAARFGEMMRLGGKNAWGEQIVPKEVVDDIIAGGSELNVKQFSKSDSGQKGSAYEGWAYRNQYWVKPNHIFSQVGIHGQYVWVDVKANLVIAKFSSFPTASGWINDDENLQAFYGLGKHFQGIKQCATEEKICPSSTKIKSNKSTENILKDHFSTNKISCDDFFGVISTDPNVCSTHKEKFVKRCCRE